MVKKKEIKNKKAIFAIGALVLVAAIGGVIAANRTLFPFNNNFTLGDFKTEVQETFDSPDDWKPCDQTQKTMTIRNTGSIDAEVRVGMNEQWVSRGGDQLDLVKDGVQLASYTLANNRWTLRNGYYYLDSPLAAGQSVDFLSSVSFNCAADFGENQMVDGNGNVVDSTVDDYNGASYHLVVTAQLLNVNAGVRWSDAFGGWEEPETFALLNSSFTSNLKSIAGNYNPVAAVKRSLVNPDLASLPSSANYTNIASDGTTPVYAWYVASEEAIYLYSSADAITLRSGDNIGGLFSGAVFTKKATDVSGLKYLDTKNLANVGGLYGPYLADDMSDLSHWDLTGVTSWGGGFNSYFTQAQMAVVENWKVPNNVSLSGMMSGNSNITNLEFLKNWDTTQVANHNNEFVGMPGLKSTKGAGKLVGSAATNLSNMFAGDSNLASLESLDKWDVSNVTTMAAMFPSTKLNDLSPLRNWNVSSVEEFNSMFASISALTDIGPLANWNVSSATNLSGMFASTYITDVCSLAGWDASSVTDFSNMFYKTKISDASCLNGWQVDSSANLSMMFKDTQITDESKYPSWYTADRRGN